MNFKLLIPDFWRTSNILSQFLLPIAFLYNLIATCLRYVPSAKIYFPKAKVITVGNIIMGGAGKTPVAISIAQILKNHHGKKIAFLTRGYLGSLQGPVIVKNHSVQEVGDEALLLEKIAPTCVAKDRLKGIKFLEDKGYEIIITDDGLQDERFYKSLTIMVVDGSFGFGNKALFPAGPLRESLESGLKKANFIALIGEGEIKVSIPIVKATIANKIVLNQKKFIAFAGIGNPNKFFRSVVQAEGIIVKQFIFPDHHNYTVAEIEYLLQYANDNESELITTEKDFVRIDDAYKAKIKTLPIDLVWQNEEILFKYLKKI